MYILPSPHALGKASLECFELRFTLCTMGVACVFYFSMECRVEMRRETVRKCEIEIPVKWCPFTIQLLLLIGFLQPPKTAWNFFQSLYSCHPYLSKVTPILPNSLYCHLTLSSSPFYKSHIGDTRMALS